VQSAQQSGGCTASPERCGEKAGRMAYTEETIYSIHRGGKQTNGERQNMEISKENQEMEKEGKEETQILEVHGEKYYKEERNETTQYICIYQFNRWLSLHSTTYHRGKRRLIRS
jgi:hypothetical protein